MPVLATMPTAWPLLMVVPAKIMHSCACSSASTSLMGSVYLGTATDSPVRLACSTRSVAVFSFARRRSAGTCEARGGVRAAQPRLLLPRSPRRVRGGVPCRPRAAPPRRPARVRAQAAPRSAAARQPVSDRGAVQRRPCRVAAPSRTILPSRSALACSLCSSLSASSAFSALLSCGRRGAREQRARGDASPEATAQTRARSSGRARAIHTPTVALSTKMRTMTPGSMNLESASAPSLSSA